MVWMKSSCWLVILIAQDHDCVVGPGGFTCTCTCDEQLSYCIEGQGDGIEVDQVSGGARWVLCGLDGCGFCHCYILYCLPADLLNSETSIISCKVFVRVIFHNAFPLRISFPVCLLVSFLHIPGNSRTCCFYLQYAFFFFSSLIVIFSLNGWFYSFSESHTFCSFDLHIHWLRGSDWLWTWIWIWKKVW